MDIRDSQASSTGHLRRAPNYHSRGVRRRLLFLVAALMAVLVAMNEARKPTTWSWLFRGDARRPLPIDTRVELDSDNQFDEPIVGQRSPPPPQAATRSDDTRPDTTRADESSSDGKRRPATGFEQVRDDTVWRPEERAPWFALVEQLRGVPEGELRSQSLGVVGFVQLFRQSAEYRGRLVTVRGTAKLGYRVPAARNDLGVEDYCLFWLQPEDGTNLPIVVYALQPPPGFPALTRERTALLEPMEVTGFFFKRWVYEAADGLNSAPVLIAQVPRWTPAPAPPESMTQKLARLLGPWFWPAAALVVTCLAGIGGGFAWLVHATSRPRPVRAFHRPPESLSPLEAEQLSQLPPVPSVEESLRKLGE